MSDQSIKDRWSDRLADLADSLGGLLGAIAGLLALAFFVLFLAASCTPKPKADGRLIVIDEANLLQPNVEEAIASVRFPKDIPVILRTVDSIPIKRIGIFATSLMDEEEAWQELRPRGFLRRYFKQDFPQSRGIYILASSEPTLLQIRFGRDIRLAAYNAGIASGEWYRDHQESIDGDAILATVHELAGHMAEIDDAWFLRRWAEWWASLISSEIEDFLAPSEGLYTDVVLTNYIALANSLKATKSSWRFVAFILGSVVAIWMLTHKLLPRLFKPRWAKAVVVGLGNVLLIGVLMVGFASLAFLSKGRIEDQLALDAMGLSFISTVGFSPTWFSTNGGWWLALPGAIIAFIGEAMESYAQSEELRRQGTDQTNLTFGWLAWACALYLLPLAIALPAFVMVIWNTGQTLASRLDKEDTADPGD